eukprot:452028-Pelagomonas_calceolata.AAC.1
MQSACSTAIAAQDDACTHTHTFLACSIVVLSLEAVESRQKASVEGWHRQFASVTSDAYPICHSMLFS